MVRQGIQCARARAISLAVFAVLALSGCASTADSSCSGSDAYPVPANLCHALVSEEAPVIEDSSTEQGPMKRAPASSRAGKKIGSRLTVSELVRQLIRTNPDVGIAAAREKEQQAAIDGARATLLPSLEVTGSAGPQRNWTSSPSGDAVRREFGVSFRQNLFDFGAGQNSVDRATLAYDSARSSRIGKTEQTTFDMLDTLMKVQQIDESIRLAKRNIEAHQAILRQVQSSETNGNSTVSDVKRVTTRLESAKTNLIDLSTERTNAADAFRRLTDVEVDKVSDNVTRRFAGRSIASAPAAASAALERNPDIVSLHQEIAALRAQLASVEAGFMPNVGLESSFKIGRQMNEPGDADRRMVANVLVSVRMPILDGGANQSTQRQVLARIEAAQLRLDKRRRELVEDARGVARITSSDSDKSSSLATRVAAARQVQELSFAQFKEGGRTVFELLDSQVDLVKAETDLITQTYSRRRSQIRMALLKGVLVQELLAAGDKANKPRA